MIRRLRAWALRRQLRRKGLEGIPIPPRAERRRIARGVAKRVQAGLRYGPK